MVIFNQIWKISSVEVTSPFHQLTWDNDNPRIDNYTHYKVWDEITSPFQNFNGGTVEVWEWIRNFIPRFIRAVGVTWLVNTVSSRENGVTGSCHITYFLCWWMHGYDFWWVSVKETWPYFHWPARDVAVNFKLIIQNSTSLGIHSEMVLRSMPRNLTNKKSTLVQVMILCHQATSYYLNRCWHSYINYTANP